VPIEGITKLEIRKIAKRLPRLGAGAFRSVYALSDTEVLKVDHADRGGYGSCEQETKTFNALAGSHVSRFLAPVLDSGKGWLIMARAHGYRTLSYAQVREVTDALSPCGIGDLHDGNVALLNGSPVATDYGHSHPIVPNKRIAQIVKPSLIVQVFDQDACVDCGETVCRCNEISFLPSWVANMR